MLNRDLRYIPILEYIPQNKDARILEVGSGTEGMTPYLPQKIFGVDLNFEDYAGPIKHRPRLAPGMVGILADSRRLPFAADAFDVVICMDMLEHIPPQFRTTVIRELWRVTGETLILGFPCGEMAMQSERRLQSTFNRLKLKLPLWLVEHLQNGLPGPEAVSEAIIDQYKIIALTNENHVVHYLLILLESIRGLYFLPLLISRILRAGLRWRSARKYLIPAVNGLFSIGKPYRMIFFVSKN